MRGLRVGIVGGSVGGCAAALGLMRHGYDITLFERSQSHLEDRGAGIGMPIPLLDDLKMRGLVGDDFAYLPIDQRYYLVRSGDWMGRLLWEQPLGDLALTNWGVLFRQLRARVPDTSYRVGVEVAGVEQRGDSAVLRLVDGTTEEFDLVVFADGHESLGRALLFPAAKAEYSGYIAWRGLLNETLAPDVVSFADPARGELTGQHAFMGARGHGIVYLVPGKAGATQPGHRLINWLWYENVGLDALPAAMASRRGDSAGRSVAPGDLPANRLAYLRAEAKRLFPPYFTDIIEKTAEPFAQAIFDMHVPRYRHGRACLLGDAATVVRPNSASGVVHAMTNALALADALAASESVEAALTGWEVEQEALGERLLRLGQSVGGALQDEATDWTSMTHEMMPGWWAAAIAGHPWYVTDVGERQG